MYKLVAVIQDYYPNLRSQVYYLYFMRVGAFSADPDFGYKLSFYTTIDQYACKEVRADELAKVICNATHTPKRDVFIAESVIDAVRSGTLLFLLGVASDYYPTAESKPPICFHFKQNNKEWGNFLLNHGEFRITEDKSKFDSLLDVLIVYGEDLIKLARFLKNIEIYSHQQSFHCGFGRHVDYLYGFNVRVGDLDYLQNFQVIAVPNLDIAHQIPERFKVPSKFTILELK